MRRVQILYERVSKVLPGNTWTAREHGSMGSISIVIFSATPSIPFDFSTPFKDRLSMLRVLMGGADLLFHFNALALTREQTNWVSAQNGR